jgi:hypothetical protein
MRTNSRLLALLAAGAAAMALIGCGGDDDDGGDAGGLSQQELNRQTATICRDANKRIAAVEQPADMTNPEQAADFFAELDEINKQGLSELRSLEPEEALTADYNRFVDAIADQSEFIEGILGKARAKDPTGLQDLQEQIENPTLQTNIQAAADKAGLTGCAKQLG